MNKHLENEKISLWLFLTIWLVYSLVYMTKTNYSATIAAIVNEGFLTKANSGAISAGFYLTYGIGQICGGLAADKFSPYKLIFFGVIGTCICNIAMLIYQSFVPMLIIWSINGIVQFGIWPAIVKLITTNLVAIHRNKALIYVSLSSVFGSILSYAVAAIVNKWQQSFIISAITMAIIAVIWFIVSKTCVRNLIDDKPEKESAETSNKDRYSFASIYISSGLIFILIASISRSILDIGIKTWFPTMIMETYKSVSPSFASALAIILLVFNALGVFATRLIYPKHVKNIVLTSGIILLISMPFLLALTQIGTVRVGWIVILLTVMTTLLTFASPFVGVIFASKFTFCGKSATVSGLLNAMAAFGAVLSNYGYGYIAGKYSWYVTILVWIALMLFTIAMLFIALPFWKRFSKIIKIK